MKKLAVVAIISAMSVLPSWSKAGDTQNQTPEQLYVVLGKHCFNREFNESLFNDLIERGVRRDMAEEKASGDYTVNNEFCVRFRGLIETLSAKSKNKNR